VVPSEDQVVGEAQKLVSRRPDLILVWTGSVAAARAAKDATHTIPIVLMAVPDVVEHGLVVSLSRPGGNITGISVTGGFGTLNARSTVISGSEASRTSVG
jgi:putative ABC transport system substrate-binding protein